MIIQTVSNFAINMMRFIFLLLCVTDDSNNGSKYPQVNSRDGVQEMHYTLYHNAMEEDANSTGIASK